MDLPPAQNQIFTKIVYSVALNLISTKYLAFFLVVPTTI